MLILQFALLKFVARLRGFEPPTHGLEVRSSIHLSYRRVFLWILRIAVRCPLLFIPSHQGRGDLWLALPQEFGPLYHNYSVLYALSPLLNWSGRADLNGRPPAPKAGALTKLRYAPFLYYQNMIYSNTLAL